MPEVAENQGLYGIEATKRFMNGLGRSAVLGFYLFHDGIGVDDAFKAVGQSDEIRAIFGDFSVAPEMVKEVKDLSFLEIAELNKFQGEVVYNVTRAAQVVVTTGNFPVSRSNGTEYGIMATKRVLDGFSRSAILGYFVGYDGFSFDDIQKLISSLPEITQIFGDFSQMPEMLHEIKDLSLLEVAEINIYQAQCFRNVALAIERIQQTGMYKEIRSLKRLASA